MTKEERIEKLENKEMTDFFELLYVYSLEDFNEIAKDLEEKYSKYLDENKLKEVLDHSVRNDENIQFRFQIFYSVGKLAKKIFGAEGRKEKLFLKQKRKLVNFYDFTFLSKPQLSFLFFALEIEFNKTNFPFFKIVEKVLKKCNMLPDYIGHCHDSYCFLQGFLHYNFKEKRTNET